MIVIVLAILGAALGWRMAKNRDGNRMDKLQYGAAFMLAFFIIGLFITVILDNFI